MGCYLAFIIPAIIAVLSERRVEWTPCKLDQMSRTIAK